MRFLKAMFIACLPFWAGAARAEAPAGGVFIAAKECPATPAIRKPDNPGDVRIAPGKAYPLKAYNKLPPTHAKIEIPGASPALRWVEIGCGTPNETPLEALPTPEPANGQYLLAASWQPAFCETRPNKRECETQTAERADAKRFSLHGLWPQPKSNVYCGVSGLDEAASSKGDWTALPAVTLSPALKAELDAVMPGTQSFLERHEWTKHGTCYGGGAEKYYRDSVDLMTALNASALAPLFASRIGQILSINEIRAAADESFGAGAGARIAMTCVKDGPRNLIVEIWLNLGGPLSGGDLAKALAAGEPPREACPAGLVDAVGLQ